MKDGWIKVASAAPALHLADCRYNGEQIASLAREAAARGAKLLVTPELVNKTVLLKFFAQNSPIDLIAKL